MVTEQLRLVVRVLRHARYSQAASQSLYAIAAELARLAGWTSYDAGDHGTAQRYYLIGIRAAYEADAPGIGANILRCVAEQASSLGDPLSGVEILRGEQAFVCLKTADDGTARGRCDVGASFMRLRTQREDEPLWRVFSPKSAAYFDTNPRDISITTATAPPPGAFADQDAAFALGLLLPGWRAGRRPLDGFILLSHRASGSWATVVPADRAHRVYYQGPRHLWEDLDAAYHWWVDVGRPDCTRFGLTVTPAGQTFWLDDPGNPLPPIGESAG
jgi:hypothetical protein